MSRAALVYGDAATRPVDVAGAVDVTTPVAGFYKVKLSRDTVLRGVQLYFGPPNDPITGEPLDRSWRWQARLDDGEAVDFERVWPMCAADPISELEFKRLRARVNWARENAPDSAFAERGAKIDLLSRSHPLPF